MAPRLRGALLVTAALFAQTFAQTSNSNATALNIPVSQYWYGQLNPLEPANTNEINREGQDGGGVWSTFALQAGSPAQNVRLLPGTSSTSIWVVVPEGCQPDYGSNETCTKNRGGIFDRTASDTWNQIGIYNLNLFTEEGIGYSGNGIYGQDTITLGLQGSGLPTLNKQVMAGIAAPQFWLGSLPLSPWPVNFTTMNEPQDGLLTSLKKSGDIPSLSWGYTAGANGREPQVYGSLTLGGYDTSRFVENNVTFGMYADISRDLLMPVSQIQTSNGFRYSPSEPEYYFIDSLVPDLWLPPDACKIFEEAFSLTLDNETGLYLVNDSLHSQLQGQNNSVTFTIGPGKDVTTGKPSDTTVEIEMPYWAFDLTAGYPYINNSNTTTNYFPLRQANDNTTQYIFGRAFLQSAYLIADHERYNFSVSQALYPGDGVSQNLVPVLAQGSNTGGGSSGSNSGGTTTSTKSSSGISGGAIAGIVIGVIAALALAAVAGFILWRKKRRHHGAVELPLTDREKRKEGPPDAHTPLYEADDGLGAAGAAKMDRPNGPFAEVEGNESSIFEAPEDGAVPNEMDGYGSGKPQQNQLHQNVFEMDSGTSHIPEMESPYATPRETPSHTPAPGYGGQLGHLQSPGAPSPGVFSPTAPSPGGAPSPLQSDRSTGPSPLHEKGPLRSHR